MANVREQIYNEIVAEFGTTVTRPQFKAYEDRTGRNPFPFLAISKFRVAGSKGRKSTRLNSSHVSESRMPSSA